MTVGYFISKIGEGGGASLPAKISNEAGSFQMPLIRDNANGLKNQILQVFCSQVQVQLYLLYIYNNLFFAVRQQKSLHNKVSISQRTETSFSAGKLQASFQ